LAAPTAINQDGDMIAGLATLPGDDPNAPRLRGCLDHAGRRLSKAVGGPNSNVAWPVKNNGALNGSSRIC
jgi:hypothetical protein